jgi:hypothetical protein
MNGTTHLEGTTGSRIYHRNTVPPARHFVPAPLEILLIVLVIAAGVALLLRNLRPKSGSIDTVSIK